MRVFLADYRRLCPTAPTTGSDSHTNHGFTLFKGGRGSTEPADLGVSVAPPNLGEITSGRIRLNCLSNGACDVDED